MSTLQNPNGSLNLDAFSGKIFSASVYCQMKLAGHLAAKNMSRVADYGTVVMRTWRNPAQCPVDVAVINQAWMTLRAAGYTIGRSTNGQKWVKGPPSIAADEKVVYCRRKYRHAPHWEYACNCEERYCDDCDRVIGRCDGDYASRKSAMEAEEREHKRILSDLNAGRPTPWI